MAGRVIAIDGPAASGKSSVARGVASALGYLFVSSGHFYRAIAWGALRDRLDLKNVEEWMAARKLTATENEKTLLLHLDGTEVTTHLSDPDVAAMVSQLAAFPAVRNAVNALLRSLAMGRDLVMEGRDIGSVVFPETPWKFYLDASPEERARRRAKEGSVDPVAERDHLDSTRATAPLMIAQGATVIDTTHLDLNQVIAAVLAHLKESTLPGN
jgi:cytidylate kinase